MSEPVAIVRDISKRFGSGATLVHALRDVSFSVHAGEIVMIKGPSGSGKTTLLHILGLLQRHDDGDMWLNGRPMKDVLESELPAARRQHVAFIFQGSNLLESLTVWDNVVLGARLRSSRNGEQPSDAALAGRCLELVNMTARKRHLPATLSGGERQRASIARALASPGRLLLADEPTANLDWEHARDVMQCLSAAAHDHGKAVVLVSHDSRLEPFVDKIVHLVDGRMADDEGTHASDVGTMTERAPVIETADRRGGRALAALLWIVTLLVMGGGGWWFGSQQKSASRSVSSPATPNVTERTLDQGVVAAAPAVVEPISQVIALRAERSGRIVSIAKQAGERVTIGESLVTLDDTIARATVALRRADLKLARANLADLNAWTRSEERQQARAAVDKAKARHERAKREHDRIAALHAQSQAADTEFNEAVEDLRLAEAELESKLAAARMSEAGPTPDDLAIAEANVEQAQAALKLAEADLDKHVIRSPIDGHVLYRHLEPGEIFDIDAEQQPPILSLGNVDRIRLRAEVDEADISRVFVGQSVMASTDALADVILRGTVVHMEGMMGRKSIRTQSTTERLDTKVREVLIDLGDDCPPMTVDLQLTVRFLADDTDTGNP